MLIELQLTKIGLGTYSNAEVESLENIGTVASFGHHLVTGSRAVLSSLGAMAELSARSRRAFSKLRADLTQVHGAAMRLRRKVVVSDQINAIAFDSGVWSIPLSEFRMPTLVSRPELIAENLEDAKFYVALSLAYGHHVFGAHLPVGYRPRGAGGSTMPGELEAVVAAGPSFVFCVADSDRSWSGGSLGSVALACRQKLPNATWHAELQDNFVRTIENLLSHSWIEKTDFYFMNRHLCDSIERVRSACPSELGMHANLKSSLRICFYREHPDMGARAAFAPGVAALQPTNPCTGNQCSITCFEFGGLHSAVQHVRKFLMDKPGLAGRLLQIGSVQERLGELIFEFGIGWTAVRS